MTFFSLNLFVTYFVGHQLSYKRIIICLVSLLFVGCNPIAINKSNSLSQASSYSILVGTYTNSSVSESEASRPYASEGIYSLSYNAQKSSFSQPTLAARDNNPSYGAINNQKNLYYSVGESETGRISAFKLSSDAKNLSLINRVNSGGTYPCFISLSPDNSLLAVANYGSGGISIQKVNPKTGAISKEIANHQYSGNSINTSRQKSPHAHWVNWSSDGTKLYAVDLGTDKVTLYEKKTAWQEERVAIKLKPGSGPRHIIMHPHENLIYILNELTNDVVSTRIQPDGTLHLLQKISTLPANYYGESQAGHIEISEDGKFLYVSNRGHNSITVFRTNIDGNLQHIQTISTRGSWPRFFTLTPDQHRMFVANQHSHSIAAFTINYAGYLELEKVKKLVPQPTYLQVIRNR